MEEGFRVLEYVSDLGNYSSLSVIVGSLFVDLAWSFLLLLLLGLREKHF